MNYLSIKIKIIALIAGIGIILSLLLAVFSPNQAKQLGKKILKTDTEFISNLLADNLALGMQTYFLDDGAVLQQTLDLLHSSESHNNDKAISNVWVYDEDGHFIKALHVSEKAEKRQLRQVKELVIEELKTVYKVWAPMKDSNKNLLGYVEIDYSKALLNKQAARNSFSALSIAMVVFMTTLFLAILLGRRVTDSIQKVTLGMKDIAQGDADLTKHLEIRSMDEVGELAKWFNTFLDRLHDIITQVKRNTEFVADAASAINSTSTQLAAGAEEQTQQTTEVATSVQKMAAAIVENSRNAHHSAGIAKKANEKAQEGTEAMHATQQGMEDIELSTRTTGDIVISLTNRAEQIGEIIQVIDDIADQTNLLALNAAIEAARAGEQGRGFAVVADEVRKLAERTTKATKEIANTIKAIQNDTKKASESMDVAHKKVNTGKEATLKTREVLNTIVNSVTQAMEMIQQIAIATEQQGVTAEGVSSSLEAISSVTKQSAIGTEKLANAADELNRQTDTLRNLIAQFKLRKAEENSNKIPKPDKIAIHNGGLSKTSVNSFGQLEKI